MEESRQREIEFFDHGSLTRFLLSCIAACLAGGDFPLK